MLEDTRQKGKKIYKIWDIVVIRVIDMIDSKELNRIFIEFCQRIQTPKKKEFKEIISLDRKIEKGSARQEGLFYKGCKPLNFLNVYSDKLEMFIDQEMIEDKINEIPTIKKIVERLNLKNVMRTWDALNIKKTNIKAVVEKG